MLDLVILSHYYLILYDICYDRDVFDYQRLNPLTLNMYIYRSSYIIPLPSHLI